MRKIIAYWCVIVLTLTVCFVPVSFDAEAISIPNISDSYTFDFEDGGLIEYTSAGVSSVDSQGNTFYPLRSSGSATATQETITVTDKDGNEQTIGTLSLTATGTGMYIPVDQNGEPFEIDPNSTYTVNVKTYVKRTSTWGQLFFGGGVINADESSYQNGGNVTFADSTNAGSTSSLKAIYPIFRTASHSYNTDAGLYTSSANGSNKVRYFEDYNQNNAGQYFESTLTFKTGNFNKENGCFSLLGSDGNNYKFGAYFGIYIGGSTVNCYDGDTLVNNGPVAYNIDSITITKTAQNVNLTLDANGGSFSSGTAISFSVNIGSGIAPSELPVYDGYKFKGWSFSQNGEIISGSATGEWNNKTLYAIWEVDMYHGYDRFERYIDYSAYTVKNRKNSWSYTTDSEPYQSIVKDENMSGGAYLHFHCDAGTAGTWLGGYTLTLTASGSCDSTGSGENNVKFPENTTYKATVSMRTNNLSGREGMFFVSYGSTFNSALSAAANNYSVLLTGVKESDDFVTYELIFTTPAEYSGKYYNCFIGFTVGGNLELDYDIDDITIQKVSKVELYTVENGETTLADSKYYQPGDFVDLPDSIKKEVYSDIDNTAITYNSVTENWYSDEELSVSVETQVRAADTDSSYYSETVTGTINADNQIGFCGFDLYKEDVESTGIELDGNLQVTDKESYTGKNSLEATGNGVFEIRNDDFFAVSDKTTYNISFTYKADKSSTVNFGLGEIYNIENNAAGVQYALEATDEWETAQVTFTADFAAIKNLEKDPCFVANIITDGTVYIDSISISSIVGSIGTVRLKDSVAQTLGSQALRFMMAYKAAENADEIYISGEKHTISERGILVKSAYNANALTLENAGKGGVVLAGRTDNMDNCWSYNSVTGNVVFSAYVKDLKIDDNRNINARGYIKLSNGDVYYGDIITTNVSSITEGSGIIGDDADIVAGKINHTSTTASSITSDSAYESMNDYYLYLPEGTEIKGEEFAVYLYDSFFTLAEENLNPSFVSEYVFENGAYARITAKGSIKDLDIYVPADVAALAEKGSKEYLSYDGEALKMNENIKLMSDGAVNYIFVTDIHYSRSYDQAYRNSLVRQMNTVVNIANENDKIDFIVVGGDITTGGYSTKKAAIEDTTYILEPFKASEKPVFVLTGNHDDNSYHISSADEYNKEIIISDWDWSKYIIDVYCADGIVKDSEYADSKYYYYDMPEKKTRLVFFDTIDCRAEYDENGVITVLQEHQTDSTVVSRHYKTGYSYWGYDMDQVEWLANEAMTAPDDWNYVYLSHMGVDGATNSYGNVMYNSEYIRNIMAAYQSKTSYNTEELGDLDYSNTTGKITVMSFGHQHVELVLYSEDIDLWQISTATANIKQYKNSGNITAPSEELVQSGNINTKSYAWTWYYRKQGTPSQSCFDIISANENKVMKYAFGSGSDRVLYYK